MANTYLTRTQGTPTNNKIFTVSCWFKASQVANEMKLIYSDDNSTNNYTYIHFSDDSGRIRFQNRNGGSNNTELVFQNYIRDFSAWYHLVIAVDSTQSTASNRVKFYLNGTQYTDLDSSHNTYPPLNQSFTLNSGGYGVDIGANGYNNNAYFQGIMSHFHFVDGTAYPASTFGSTDSVTGEWQINTSPSITMGNNGFTILKDGNTITDQSSNSNDFSLGGGTLTKTEDNPSNVFCVINPADRFNGNNTNTPDNLRNGATKMVTSDANFLSTRGSIGVTSGKWYWEAKQGAGGGWAIGICNNAMVSQTSAQFWDNTTVTGVAINGSGGTAYVNGGNGDSWNQGTSVNSNTLYGFALDMDNRAFYISINGTYLTANGNVGDPTSGSSRTGSVLGELTTRGGTGGLNYIPQGELIYPFQADVSSGTYCEIEMNFGNGYFGTTAVSSAGTNASGNGIFEYDVPTGYTALSTKGLNL